MTETPTQDLAALDRVVALAARYGVHFAGTDARLRGCIEREGDRLHALGAALADLIPVLVNNDEEAIGSLMVAAIASVGAEIVWPSPDSAETPESPAEARTAPGIDTASATVKQCQRSTACVGPDEHTGPCWVITNISASVDAAVERMDADR